MCVCVCVCVYMYIHMYVCVYISRSYEKLIFTLLKFIQNITTDTIAGETVQLTNQTNCSQSDHHSQKDECIWTPSSGDRDQQAGDTRDEHPRPMHVLPAKSDGHVSSWNLGHDVANEEGAQNEALRPLVPIKFTLEN